jgi:ribosomal protein S18 acetylase RimI-like enzyme
MALEIRAIAAGDDVGLAGRIVQQAYLALPGYPAEDEYDAALADIGGRGDDCEVLVGLLDGRIVACLTYVADVDSSHAEHDDPDAASFRYFGVDAAVQGRGVGEAMVRWVLDRARADGRQRVRIHTLESMPGAMRLYERLGFERDVDGDHTWDDGVTGLAFVHHLV